MYISVSLNKISPIYSPFLISLVPAMPVQNSAGVKLLQFANVYNSI